MNDIKKSFSGFLEGKQMQRTLLIYESKYGATEKIVKYLTPILGPANYCTTDQFNDSHRNFDFFV